MDYFIYVLQSEKDGRLYKGQTSNISKRLRQHNAGENKSTKGFRPWKLVYYESFKTREEALLQEKYFKTGSGREFLKEKLKSPFP